MRIIDASVELVNAPEYSTLLETVELAGRVCYKSEDKITEGSAEKFIRGILSRGHESVIEHSSITVRFICDRGVTHEIVRHRLASYSQMSTRYCNYSHDKFGHGVTFIRPCFFEPVSNKPDGTPSLYSIWRYSCEQAEYVYMTLLENGATPEEARSVLPNSTATELVMTANLREWRHFLRLRTSLRAHPQMREVANILGATLKNRYPVFFEDFEF